MNTNDFKIKLENELATITKSLEDLAILNPQTDDKDWLAVPEEPSSAEADPNVQADRSEAWQERRSETEALETRRNNLVRALEKIEAGTFGICEISGEEIEPDRLEANPAARTCKLHMNEEAKLSFT